MGSVVTRRQFQSLRPPPCATIAGALHLWHLPGSCDEQWGPTSVRGQGVANRERESTACRVQVLALTAMLLAQEAVEWRAFLHPEEPWGLLLLAFSAAAVRGRWHGRPPAGFQSFQTPP